MKRLFLLFFIVFSGSSLKAQPFERLLALPSTNYSMADVSYDFDTLLGGIVTDNNFPGTTDSNRVYAFDRYGNTLWSKSRFRLDSLGLRLGKFSSAVLDNGHYILAGTADNDGSVWPPIAPWNAHVISELDNAGNLLSTRISSIDMLLAWDYSDIDIFPLRNGSSEYYAVWRVDSVDLSASPHNFFSTLFFQKAATGGTIAWTKSYTCTDTSSGATPHLTKFHRTTITQEGGLAMVYKNECIPSGGLAVLEKVDNMGNTIFQVDLQPYFSPALDSFGIAEVISCRDSSIVVIARRSWTWPTGQTYLMRFDQSGNLIDSVSYINMGLGSGFETPSGDLLVNFYSYFPTGYFAGSGMIRFDHDLNYLTTHHFPFQENFYGRERMIPNNIGGAFFAFCRFSLYSVNKHIRIVNVDSTLTSYPAEVNGNISMDINANCIADGTDYGLRDRMVILTNTSSVAFYSFTDAIGDYEARIPSGTYSVTHIPQGAAGIECPATAYNIPVVDTSVINGLSFNDTLPGTMNDLKVQLYSDPFVPGFNSIASLVYYNDGAIDQPTTIKFAIDPGLSVVSSIPLPSSISGDTLIYLLSSFAPDSANIIDVELHVDSTVALGTPFQLLAVIDNGIADIIPSNNADTLSGVIVGAFDPNDKSVNQPQYIQGNEELVYKIRFQNTGTLAARKVVLNDSLSTYLDLSTLRSIEASHPYTMELKTNGRMVISFDNINLPDSTSNEPGSHGYFVYSIKPKSTLAIGQKIRNKAYIYFDYNAPVITNTTLNQKIDPASSISTLNKELSCVLYPNPTSNFLQIRFDSHVEASFRIHDILGKIIYENVLSGSSGKISVSSLEDGIYFLNIETEEGRKLIKKFIVAH